MPTDSGKEKTQAMKTSIQRATMITVNKLSYTYVKSQRPAVNDLSFNVHPGEIFGFLGPSGAGKSTTQKILIGLLRDYQGNVSIFDKKLEDWGSDFYERIGVAFEVPNLFLKLTALENLTYFGALYQQITRQPEELLALVGLEEDGNTPVGQYSKGMKNRLNVARALLHDPELLFLDEPTSGMDPVNARRIKDLIFAQRQAGKTIFLTTHNMNIAEELCDRVAFIVDGRIDLVDTPRELKLRYGQRRVLVEYGLNSHTERQEFALENLGSNTAFLDLLARQDVQTIHTQEATLEDIFIKLTGRGLQ
jgi:fluoroquinolone transport system ATP-binding protein